VHNPRQCDWRCPQHAFVEIPNSRRPTFPIFD
jgi:hypothetical protein